MMFIKLRTRSQKGFTLVEVMAALAIFTAITIGIFPLLAGSMRASVRSRQATVAKNVAVEAMERIRGLPYYISLRGQRVDLLDLYYPEYDADGIYETTCAFNTISPACNALEIPEGYNLTITARFVDPATDDTYTTVLADPDYIWDYADTDERLDLPPRQLMEFTVTVAWETVGPDRTYTLRTLVVSRENSRAKVSGQARIDYAVEASTVYNTLPVSTELIATLGNSVSEIGERLTSTATHDVISARLHLIEEAIANSPEVLVVPDTLGAFGNYEAPPDLAAPDEGPISANLDHPGVVDPPFVGGFERTFTTESGVTTSLDLPSATGIMGSDANGIATDFYVNSESPLPFLGNKLRLSSASPILAVREAGGVGGVGWGGRTNTITTEITDPDRHVLSESFVSIPEIRLFPTSFAPEGVIKITDFTAEVVCEATSDTVGANPAIATIDWGATVQYATATNTSGAWSYTTVNLTDNSSTAQLPAFSTSIKVQNLDGNSTVNDLWLFDQTTTPGVVDGYLTSWSSLFDIANDANFVSAANGGRVAFANLDGAIKITTAARDASLPESGLDIAIGKLACRAEDFR